MDINELKTYPYLKWFGLFKVREVMEAKQNSPHLFPHKLHEKLDNQRVVDSSNL